MANDVGFRAPRVTEGDYYHIALQCELNKQKGCTGNCGACQFNVALYTDNFRDAALTKTVASIDAHKQYDYEQSSFTGRLFLLAIILVTTFFWYRSCTATTPQDTPDLSAVYKLFDAYGEPKNDIETAILFTHALLEDFNGDKVINCIDYSMMFKLIYEDLVDYPTKVELMRNKNPATGMDHLFVWVYDRNNYMNGGTLVEPQGIGGRWDPKVFWGAKYDPSKTTFSEEYMLMYDMYVKSAGIK
jgi:hypothetical protein